MPEVVRTMEAKVQPTCDQLITWGFSCSEPATTLAKRTDNTEYAIICAKHIDGFKKAFAALPIEYSDYSLELNLRYADEANAANGVGSIGLEELGDVLGNA